MIKNIKIDGLDITLQRKRKMKKIYLRVYPPYGQVKITAPYTTSNKVIENFVLENRHKIDASIERVKEESKNTQLNYQDGDFLYLWGEKYKLIVLEGARSYVHFHERNIVLSIRGNNSYKRREKIIREFYRKELEEELEKLVPFYEYKMSLKVNEWRSKKMKTRWGSCNINEKRIWLSLKLAKYPKDCLEAVIVHEMVHLLERKHNKRFYELLEEYYPSWREVDEILKEGLS